jgi:hypothetical protein
MQQMIRVIVVSGVAVLAVLRLVAAATLVLHPPSGTADGVLQDIGPDGVFDSAVTTGAFMEPGGQNPGVVPRQAAVVEFRVTAISPRAHLIRVRLYLDDVGGSNREPQNLQVFMYAGDGQVTVADATAPGVLVGTKTNLGGAGGRCRSCGSRSCHHALVGGVPPERRSDAYRLPDHSGLGAFIWRFQHFRLV